MTETEWSQSTDPWSMLHVLRRIGPSGRKVRLFNAAICRRFWDYLPEASQAILSESERVADGMDATESGLDLCRRANAVIHELFDRKYPTKQFQDSETRISRDAAAVGYAVFPNELWGAAACLWKLMPSEKSSHATIIRDVFGNPFRPLTADPNWLAPEVVSLAQAIYEDRAFFLMPTLGGALEKAGCNDADILAHCCSSEEHVRGCWAVDALLGKS